MRLPRVVFTAALFFSLISASPPSRAAEGTPDLYKDSVSYFFWGAGQNLSPFGALRFGNTQWGEIGLMNYSLGVAKIFRLESTPFYAGLGLVYYFWNPAAGLYASVGFEKIIWSWGALRGELSSVATYKGNFAPVATLGAAFFI